MPPKRTVVVVAPCHEGSPANRSRILRASIAGPSRAAWPRPDLVAASQGLHVAAMEAAGWSDCTTPERLVAALADHTGTLLPTDAAVGAVA